MTIKIGSLFAPDTSAHKSPANEQPPNINPSFQTTNLKSLDHLSARISASSFDRNNPVRQTEADAAQTFKTNGGSWRIRNTVENDTPRFYRNGADTSKTTRFDKEFYTDKNTGKWIHLNSSGRLADLPELKNKAKPEGVSAFDWQGWAEVSASDVPGEYTADGKTVEFGNPANADDAGIVLRRYVQQNVIGEGWTGDTTTDGWAAIRAREWGVKVEAEAVGTNEKGDTVFRVKVSEADLAKLRQVKAEWTAKKAEQARNNEQARNETNEQFLDLGRELWNAGVNIVEGTVNTALDAAQTNGGTNPLPLMNPNRPQADFSSAKMDYRSEMMRRDLNGKLDGKGIKAGQAIETVVTIAAPIVVGAAITPKAAPQSLKTLGGIPEVETSATTAAKTAAQTVNKVGKLEIEQGRTLSPSEQKFANKMVAEGRNVKAPKEVNQQGIKNPDFHIDNEIVEFKYVSDLKGTTADKLSARLSGRILDGGSQASKVSLDITDQAGMTEEIARRSVGRAFGRQTQMLRLGEISKPKLQEVRIYGKNFDLTITYKMD